jgi:hypothetical protein
MIAIRNLRHLRRSMMVFSILLGLMMLSACAEQIWASDADVQAARHAHGGAPELTLVTIMNYASKRGDHSALFINGAERVIFDPAGSWRLESIPERNDVHFGMTYAAGASFYASHVRPSHYAVVQRLVVAPEVAAQAMTLALQNGPVPPARCALATSALLRQLPGLDGIRGTLFPQVLMRDFAQLPDVQSYELHYDAPEYQNDLLRVQRPL